jgi:glycosyltransferase XagB
LLFGEKQRNNHGGQIMGDRRSTDFLAASQWVGWAGEGKAQIIQGNPAHIAALDATAELALSRPGLSARFTGAAAGLAIGMIAVAVLVGAAPWIQFLNPLVVAAGSLFLTIGLARLLLALCAIPVQQLPSSKICDGISESDLPVYSVLIALHREASVVEQLVDGLSSFDWPKEKLDVIFVIEEADVATRTALEAQTMAFPARIMILPPVGPMTKPKALQAALPITRGNFVCVYDAEDRPHPDQLKSAFKAFQSGRKDLACVQAPLVTWNHRESWIAGQFSLDYAIWFQLVLPGLARIGHFLPLGGTSNHFKREALVSAGGWDPFNVTEDADLALRLVRDGWRIGTIAPPTREEAPPAFRNWVRQRSRWIQGHAITVAVHARQPRSLIRGLGVGGVFSAVIALAVGPLAALLRAPMMLALAWYWIDGTLPIEGLVLAISGIGVEVLLALLAIVRDGRWSLLGAAATLPLYHVAQTFPAILALSGVLLRPHFWQKTDHGDDARVYSKLAKPG